MKKIVLLASLNLMKLLQGMNPEVAFKKIITRETMPEFLATCPCFFIIDKTSITAEYLYLEGNDCKSILVAKDLWVEKMKKVQKFDCYGPFEYNQIFQPYFFKNQGNFPHLFKKKANTSAQDIEEIKNLINNHQQRLLSLLQKGYLPTINNKIYYEK